MKYRHKLVLLLTAVSLLMFTACGNKQEESTAPSTAVSVGKQTSTNLHSGGKGQEQKEEKKEEQNEQDTVSVDYDLTKMSSTMVYAEVSNMMMDPESYIGKVICMRGKLEIYTNEDNTVFYPACIVADATACCANGIEFVMPEGENPVVGEDITVTGVFEKYMEGEYAYYHLVDAVITY